MVKTRNRKKTHPVVKNIRMTEEDNLLLRSLAGLWGQSEAEVVRRLIRDRAMSALIRGGGEHEKQD